MQIHHVAKQHVRISHQMHTIQVMQVVIVVVGVVMHEQQEVHVQHVEIDNIVQHVIMEVVVVQRV